jgi:hypothetical protein
MHVIFDCTWPLVEMLCNHLQVKSLSLAWHPSNWRVHRQLGSHVHTMAHHPTQFSCIHITLCGIEECVYNVEKHQLNQELHTKQYKNGTHLVCTWPTKDCWEVKSFLGWCHGLCVSMNPIHLDMSLNKLGNVKQVKYCTNKHTCPKRSSNCFSCACCMIKPCNVKFYWMGSIHRAFVTPTKTLCCIRFKMPCGVCKENLEL